MGAIANLTHEGQSYSDGLDSVVIRRRGATIIGGKTLDLSGFSDTKVRAGHIIIHQTATDTYKPLGVTEGAYQSLPAGHTYAGVLISSVTSRAPFGSVMYEGEVNDVASPVPLTDALKTALRAALPGLYFMHD